MIPFARGKSRSIPIRDLVARVLDLQRTGVQEVVLTGVHIGDYEDAEDGLADLVEALLEKTGLQRFRLSSLEPPELTDRLMSLFTSAGFAPISI